MVQHEMKARVGQQCMVCVSECVEWVQIGMSEHPLHTHLRGNRCTTVPAATPASGPLSLQEAGAMQGFEHHQRVQVNSQAALT